MKQKHPKKQLRNLVMKNLDNLYEIPNVNLFVTVVKQKQKILLRKKYEKG